MNNLKNALRAQNIIYTFKKGPLKYYDWLEFHKQMT